MKVILLAGGFGSRLSEYTEVLPKPMVPIGGKLTSARADAAEMIDAVYVSLKKTPPPCSTEEQSFPWRPPGNWQDFLLVRRFP